MHRRFFSGVLVLVGVLSSGSSVIARIDSIWNFDGDLQASSGTATMSFRGDMGLQSRFFASEHDLGFPAPFGDHGGVLSFGSTTPAQGLSVNLNNGGATVGAYTMVWDVFRPAPSWDRWMPLLQTNVANSDDSDFFINPGDGIGINGVYQGRVTDTRGNIGWNRIALTRAADGTARKYIDGQLVGTQTLSGARWDLNGGFGILMDENNESSQGYLSSFRFADRVFSQAEIESLGKTHAQGTNVAGQQLTGNPATVTPGSFTIAIVGDTQNYSSSRPEIFHNVTQWIADNAAARNIRFVIQDGDIVNTASVTSQWNVARAAMDRLNGVVPYAVVRGNHDIGSQYDLPQRFGPGSPYSQQPTLTGYYEVPNQPTWDMRNTYHTFEANGQEFLVLTVDISAGPDVVAWANQVIESNPYARVILDTHAYSYDGGQRFNHAIDPHDPQGRTVDQVRDELLRQNQPDSIYNGAVYGGQDGETLWQNLVSQHENVAFMISGHQFEDFDQFKYHQENGVHGNSVHELLVDPQNMANGGNGWIRLLEFDPDNLTVHVKTFSPFLNQWDNAPDLRYDILMSPAPRLDGDFNNDGAYRCDDIDALTDAIASGASPVAFDLTGDDRVDLNDLHAWLAEAGQQNLPSGQPYIVGDANLDGAVDGSDFNFWNGYKFTQDTAWCHGNFSADAVIDGADFALWNSHKFTSANGRLVPEPVGTLGIAGLVGWVTWLRSRTPRTSAGTR